LETSSKIENGDLLEVSFKEEKVNYFDDDEAGGRRLNY